MARKGMVDGGRPDSDHARARAALEAIGIVSGQQLCQAFRAAARAEGPLPAEGGLVGRLVDVTLGVAPTDPHGVDTLRGQLLREVGALASKGLLGRGAPIEAIGRRLADLYDDVVPIAELARRSLAECEGSGQPRGLLGWLLGGASGGKTTDAVKEALRQEAIRTATDRLDAIEAVVSFLAVARERVGAVERRGLALGASVKEARDRAGEQVARPGPAVGGLPNDLPPGVQRRAAEMAAHESQEVALERGTATLGELAAAEAEPDAAAVLDRMRAEAQSDADVAQLSLAETIGRIADHRGKDRARYLSGVLGYLAGPAFARSPGIRLGPAAENQGYSFLFQVVPDGQPPLAEGSREEVREARFRQGPPTQAVVLRVRTGFQLDAVRAVTEHGGALAAASRNANPFILPELAAPESGLRSDPGHDPPSGPTPKTGPDTGTDGGAATVPTATIADGEVQEMAGAAAGAPSPNGATVESPITR